MGAVAENCWILTDNLPTTHKAGEAPKVFQALPQSIQIEHLQLATCNFRRLNRRCQVFCLIRPGSFHSIGPSGVSSLGLLLLSCVVLAAILSAALTWALRPLLVRYALARPNARSSHKIPTPQGAGIAVIGATLIVAATIILLAGSASLQLPLAVFGAGVFVAIVGAADDFTLARRASEGKVGDDVNLPSLARRAGVSHFLSKVKQCVALERR